MNNQIKARALRATYQENGKIKAKEQEILHCIGCMLYWGEGTKKKNVVEFTNMDVMLKIFINFLRKLFLVPNEKITIYINCFTNNSNDWNMIKNYWLENLKVPKTCLRKPTIKNVKEAIKNMGVCKIVVYDTKLVQHIYGAIQEYAQFDNNYCLNGK